MWVIPEANGSFVYTQNGGGDSPKHKKSNPSSLLGNGNGIFDNDNRYDSDGEASPYSLEYLLADTRNAFVPQSMFLAWPVSLMNSDKPTKRYNAAKFAVSHVSLRPVARQLEFKLKMFVGVCIKDGVRTCNTNIILYDT